MNKTLPGWAFGVLAVVGAILVGSMGFYWIDLGGLFQQRGFTLAWNDNHWLLLVPVAGATLLAAAASRSTYTRLAAIFAGVVVAGDVLFGVASSLLHARLDTWLVLGGAAVMIFGGSPQRVILRVLGGAAVIAGFFAPWAAASMFKMTGDAVATGMSSSILWLIPIAGVAGILSTGSRVTGAKLAVASGVAVYGVLLLVIGIAALLVFGLGAWAALGASSVALVIGVLARSPAPKSAPASQREFPTARS